MNRSVVMIDASGVLMRTICMMRGLNKKGQPLRGIEKTFASRVLSAVTAFPPPNKSESCKFVANKVIVCFDHSGGPRRAMCPLYKKGRPSIDKDPEISAIVAATRTLCVAMGATVLPSQDCADPVEADDLIDTAVKALAPQGIHRVVISNDKDMCQAFRHTRSDHDRTVSLFRNKNKPWLSTPLEVTLHLEGVRPQHYAAFLALAGDATDGIRSVMSKRKATDAMRALGPTDSPSKLNLNTEELKKFEYNLRLTTAMECPEVVSVCNYDTLPHLDLSDSNVMTLKDTTGLDLAYYKNLLAAARQAIARAKLLKP